MVSGTSVSRPTQEAKQSLRNEPKKAPASHRDLFSSNILITFKTQSFPNVLYCVNSRHHAQKY